MAPEEDAARAVVPRAGGNPGPLHRPGQPEVRSADARHLRGAGRGGPHGLAGLRAADPLAAGGGAAGRAAGSLLGDLSAAHRATGAGPDGGTGARGGGSDGRVEQGRAAGDGGGKGRRGARSRA